MSCPPRPDPAVHLPPGIFHTRHIAGDQSLRNKCCTSPPLNVTIPEMAKKNTRDELQTKEASRTLILCQFTVLFQCALERTHPSIHPAPFHRAGVPFLPRKVTHDRFRQVSVWRERETEKSWVNEVGRLWGQTSTWRRLTTQRTRSARWRASDPHSCPSLRQAAGNTSSASCAGCQN